MDNVTDLASVIAARSKPKAEEKELEHVSTIEIYVDEDGTPTGRFTGPAKHGETEEEHLQFLADVLENMSYAIVDRIGGDNPTLGEVIARFTVFETGTVRSWISSDVEDDEDRSWVRGCLDVAKQALNKETKIDE